MEIGYLKIKARVGPVLLAIAKTSFNLKSNSILATHGKILKHSFAIDLNFSPEARLE